MFGRSAFEGMYLRNLFGLGLGGQTSGYTGRSISNRVLRSRFQGLDYAQMLSGLLFRSRTAHPVPRYGWLPGVQFRQARDDGQQRERYTGRLSSECH